MRRFAILAVVFIGIAASVASNPLTDHETTGTVGPFTLVLDSGTPEVERRVGVQLDTKESVLAGSGEMKLLMEFSDDSAGSVRVDIESEQTNQSSSTDVFDPQDQQQVEVGMPMLEDCVGTEHDEGDCEESFLLNFARVDGESGESVTLEWSMDVSITVDLAESESETPEVKLSVTVIE